MTKTGLYYNKKYQMWWPEFDHKPDNNFSTIMKGMGAAGKAVQNCDSHDICIQAGGHIGYWPLFLSEHFNAVHSFEADPIVYNALEHNTITRQNITTYNCALSDFAGTVEMRRGASAGSTKVINEKGLTIKSKTIDWLVYENLTMKFRKISAIMLDIEGHELSVLRGAQKTIAEYKPLLLVEGLPQTREAQEQFLKTIGYTKIMDYGRDQIWKSE